VAATTGKAFDQRGIIDAVVVSLIILDGFKSGVGALVQVQRPLHRRR
jgi:hypothetical protein